PLKVQWARPLLSPFKEFIAHLPSDVQFCHLMNANTLYFAQTALSFTSGYHILSLLACL
ncbi:hypothetical protein ACJX0J_020986, partial [Zea mays]